MYPSRLAELHCVDLGIMVSLRVSMSLCVLTLEDDHIKFWCGIILPNVCGPLRPLLDMESIWMKLIVI